ncbi:uncharacterized protein LOC134842863 [Symsagittifera roscoffensis]|uniref:uncharacterized protein LOC134842863 n=1 Tax=Symsagittifera roscoffensis TaxID=84072 RepID=UPI00307CB6CE
MDLVRQFQQITGSAENVAITSLSRHNYNLESALSAFTAEHHSAGSHQTPFRMERSSAGNNVEGSSSGNTIGAEISHAVTSGGGGNLLSSVSQSAPLSSVDHMSSTLSVRGRAIPPPSSSPTSFSSPFSHITAVSNAVGTDRNTAVPVWERSTISSRTGGSSGGLLSSLFAPPFDIMFTMDFFYAKDYARERDLWLLVDIQDSTNFDCQCLNRDVWSSHEVKHIVSRHFLFLQYRMDSQDGRKFSQFYRVNHFPYVAILDPRTGELLQSFSAITSKNAGRLLTTFVRKNGAPSVCDQMRDNITSDQVVDLEDEEIEPAIVKVSTGNSTKTYHHSLNEEEALKAAIAASLDHQRRNKGGRTLGFAGSSTWSANNAPNTANIVNLSDEEGSAEVDTKDESLHADESHTRLLQSDDDDEEDSLDSMDDYSSHSSHDDTNEISLNHEEVTDNNLSSPTAQVSRKRRIDPRDHFYASSSRGPPHLYGNLKRLKLDNLSSDRSQDALSASSSGSRVLDLQVQNIGPLIPPSRHESLQFPSEVSVVEQSKTDFAATASSSSGGGESKGNGDRDEVKSVKVLLKCPNGERRSINLAHSCTLHSFFAGCGSLGFSDVLYEFTTHFPRTLLNTLDRKITLSQAGIAANCVVFVESKI